MRIPFSFLLLFFSLFSMLALAQTVAPPKIITEKNGNVTNYRAEGSLTSSRAVGCIHLDKVKNTFAPPDLYQGVKTCIAKGDYARAANLFSLAGIYSRFDAERVSDKSARQARTVLVMNISASTSQEQKRKFSEALGGIAKNPQLLGKLCNEIQKIGMPNYYPSYMILHGIKAHTGNPHEGALLTNFDGQKTWTNLKTSYLHCPT